MQVQTSVCCFCNLQKEGRKGRERRRKRRKNILQHHTPVTKPTHQPTSQARALGRVCLGWVCLGWGLPRPGLSGLGLSRLGFASAGFVWAGFASAGVCLGWGLPRPGLSGLGLSRLGFASAGVCLGRVCLGWVCLGWGLPPGAAAFRLSSLPLVLEATGVASELTGGPAPPSLRPSSVSEDSGSSLNPSRPVGPHRVQETYHHVCK